MTPDSSRFCRIELELSGVIGGGVAELSGAIGSWRRGTQSDKGFDKGSDKGSDEGHGSKICACFRVRGFLSICGLHLLNE